MSRSARSVIQSKDLVRFADVQFNTLQVMDEWHRRVRDGSLYYFSFPFLGTPAGGDTDLVMETGDKQVAINFSLAANRNLWAYLYEGATVTTPGSKFSGRNRRRQGADDTTTIQFQDPVLIGARGTSIARVWTPINERVQLFHGVEPKGAFWILAKNETYTLRVNVPGTQSATYNVECDFFEFD